MKLPAFQFYPADWRKDPGVQALSYHDRGVWFEILCLMHESEQRGKLLLNGQPMPEDALARLLGLDKQNLTKTLTTLLSYGVASRDPETGALVNRRMLKDEELRKVRKEAGKLGGNPNLVNQTANQKPTTQVKQKPTPSSSASSSEDSAKAGGRTPDLVWGQGVTLLEAAGMNEQEARSLLGGMVKKHGKPTVIASVAETLAANPANPKEYLAAVLSGKRNGGRSQAEMNGAGKGKLVL